MCTAQGTCLLASLRVAFPWGFGVRGPCRCLWPFPQIFLKHFPEQRGHLQDQ